MLGACFRLLFVYDVGSKPELNCLASPHDDYNFVLSAQEMNSQNPVLMNLPIYPAYAHFIRGIFKTVGEDVVYIKYVQCVLGLISLVTLFLTGRMIFGTTAGLLASVLYLFYGMSYFFDISIMSTALSQCLLIIGFYGFIRFQRYPSLWSYLLFWFSTLSLCLLRVHFWAFLILGVTYLYVKNRHWKNIKYSVLLVLLSGISLMVFNGAHSPESYRGKFGVLFFIGNNPDATGLLDDIKGVPRTAEGHAKESILRAYELSNGQGDIKNYWIRRVFEYWVKNPGFILPLLWKKLKLLTHNHEILDTESVYYYENHTILKKLPRIDFWFIFAFFLIGIVFALVQNVSCRTLLFVIIALTGVLLIFHISSRYRMPLMPFLALFAGFGLWQCIDHVASKKWLFTFFSLAVITITWFWSHQNMPILSIEKDMAYMENLIEYNQMYANQRKDAIALYQKWDTLPYQQAISLMIRLAHLDCYHEFFTLFDNAYAKTDRDQKTRVKLMTQKAILLEKMFRIKDAKHVWEEIKTLDSASKMADNKIQLLSIYEKYLN